jgi:hypothetical protein
MDAFWAVHKCKSKMNNKNTLKPFKISGFRVEKLPSSGVNLSHPEQVFFLTKT